MKRIRRKLHSPLVQGSVAAGIPESVASTRGQGCCARRKGLAAMRDFFCVRINSHCYVVLGVSRTTYHLVIS